MFVFPLILYIYFFLPRKNRKKKKINPFALKSTDLLLKISSLHFRRFRACGNRNRCSNFAAKIELR